MSAEFPTSVRAAQLIYSNVEAEHSPTSRRGFQVWLCSGRLKDQQREIARRLEDFDWPSPDAAKNFVTERFCYFKTTNGEFVVARTVPVTERDALRRAGRFHAHAVILPAAEFAKIGHNPFAVLDHFPFQSDPGPVIESGAWQMGLLPDEDEIRVGRPHDPDPSFASAIQQSLPLLVRWLDGPDDIRPVAIPAQPNQVAAYLRASFQVLPPWLRVRATFDTLSNGQSLGQLAYRFAGGYDVASFRDWPYRRAYRLDPATGEFPTPPTIGENPSLDHLAALWATDATLSDADKEGMYLLIRALNDSKSGPLPSELSDRVLQIVRDTPGSEVGFARLVRDRVVADLPFSRLQPMVSAAACEWIGPLSREAIARLPETISATHFAGWLTQHVEATPQLSNEEAHQLEKWSWDLLGTPDGQAVQKEVAKLYLIALRYQPNAARRLKELRSKQGWTALIDGWFCEWFLSRSVVRDLFGSEGSVTLQFAEALMMASPRLPPTAFDDAALYLAMSDPTALPHGVYRHLKFAIAFRNADAEGMSEALGERTERPFAEWVVQQMFQVGVTLRMGLGDLSEDQPGAILEPGPRNDASAIAALFDALVPCLSAQFTILEHMWAHALKQVPPPKIYPTAALQDANEIYENTKLDRRWERLSTELDSLGATEFRQFLTDRLRDKARFTRPAAARGELGVSLWVGPVIESNGIHPELFSKIYPRAVAVARKQPTHTAERVAAILCAVRVQSS